MSYHTAPPAEEAPEVSDHRREMREDAMSEREAAYREEQDEAGAAYGDPRRCRRHPHVKTSSPDGMFDAPCEACEAEMDGFEPMASDGAGGQVVAGSLDDPNNGSWDPSDD